MEGQWPGGVTERVSLGGLIEIGHTWGAVEDAGRHFELPGTTSMNSVAPLR